MRRLYLVIWASCFVIVLLCVTFLSLLRPESVFQLRPKRATAKSVVQVTIGVNARNQISFTQWLNRNSFGSGSALTLVMSHVVYKAEPIICCTRVEQQQSCVKCLQEITHANLQYKTGVWWRNQFDSWTSDHWVFKADDECD